MALTDIKVKNTKIPKDKDQVKISDGGGLFLLVRRNKKSISKYWRQSYRFKDEKKTAALGVYPRVSLKEAREKAFENKKLLENNIDPVEKKRSDKLAAIEKIYTRKITETINANTFEVVARKWFELRNYQWEASHSRTVLSRLERYIFPVIGNIPIAQLKKLQISDAIEAIVRHGTIDTAKRVTQYTRNILEYASDNGFIEGIPLGATKNLVPSKSQKPMPAIIEPKGVGQLLRAIDGYKGNFTTCCALKLLPYLAVRSGEFRQAKWKEFDFKSEIWVIPAKHRKLRRAAKENPENIHLVPLSRQAIIILKGLRDYTGSGQYVFPSIRGDKRPMSENTINSALAAMGYKNRMVGHGFRTIFSSILNEKGFNPDAIERQLAHAEPNEIRAAYNRSEYLMERTKMMQLWADCLDELKSNT